MQKMVKNQGSALPYFLFLFFMGMCTVSYSQKAASNWVQETPKAAWQARDSQGEFVFNGQMWILGGWFTPQLPNPRDVWRSPDGKNWTRVVETALGSIVIFLLRWSSRTKCGSWVAENCRERNAVIQYGHPKMAATGCSKLQMPTGVHDWHRDL